MAGWRLENVPRPVGAAENQLNGIACPATGACVAVGTVGPTRDVFSTEALRRNGRAWHLQPMPNPSGGGGMFGVACTAPSACTAVGASNVFTPNGMPLAERWNGTRWSIQATPNPSPGGFLNSVPCTSASSCTAVGARLDSAGNLVGTLIEQWNGTRWAIQSTPTQRTPGAILVSAWCQSATACIAVGNTNAGTLAERLSGTTWTVLHTPNLPGTQGDFFNSVSCTSLSACTGAREASVGPQPTQTLAERWNGARWRIQPTPLLPGSASSITSPRPAPHSRPASQPEGSRTTARARRH